MAGGEEVLLKKIERVILQTNRPSQLLFLLCLPLKGNRMVYIPHPGNTSTTSKLYLQPSAFYTSPKTNS